jgi:hypothetical protein
MTACPVCFTQLSNSLIAFRCVNPKCATQPDPKLSAYVGAQTMGRPVIQVQAGAGWTADQGARCSACGELTTVEVCTECHFAFIGGWRHSMTTCIALAGARASGKSIFIALMVKQLELWCEQYGLALMPAAGSTAEIFAQFYEKPLFEQRGLITATGRAGTNPPENSPLIFRLGVLSGHPHHLVIRDVAGEDLEDPHLDPQPFAFFNRADAVFFLFDPMGIADVRMQLAGIVQDQLIDGGDPLDVLANLIRIMHGGATVGVSKIRTRLAVVLAKFDVLAELAYVPDSPLASIMDNRGASYNRDASLERSFDVRDTMLVAAETRSLLSKLGARTLLNLIDLSFEDHHAFSVSALGTPPASSVTVSPTGIAPQRVLDPLKWTMARVGTIDAVNVPGQ